MLVWCQPLCRNIQGQFLRFAFGILSHVSGDYQALHLGIFSNDSGSCSGGCDHSVFIIDCTVRFATGTCQNEIFILCTGYIGIGVLDGLNR